MEDLQQIKMAAERLQGVARHTTLHDSPYFSKRLGSPIYFKCENMQHTGAFKIRGAYNFLACQAAQAETAGVITASAGNHGQGLASAAARLGYPCRVVMPEGVPLAKELATLHYGAEVILHGADYAAAETHARKLSAQDQALYVPAYDDPLIIAGQGTIGLEILADLPDVQTVVVPVGGGGLIAGVATAIKEARPQTRIIGVEAASVASATLARRNGRPVAVCAHGHTLADGIAVQQIGAHPFPLIEKYVDEIVTVTEEAIAMTLVGLLEKGKMVVEGAGAVGLAALLYGMKTLNQGPTVCLLSGGNLDVQIMARIIEHGMLAEGRYLKLRLEMVDMPGALAQLTGILSELKANIFQVNHDRHKSSLPLGEAEVVLDLETRGSGHIEEILLRLEEQGYRPEVLR